MVGVSERTGLRERKKLRTRHAISDAAISLFLERGYDEVSVADVAAAAEVSKPTLFKYFPAKADLVVHRFADHESEPARVVLERPGGRSPLEALHLHFLDGLARRDPITGLNDRPQVLALLVLLHSTPDLVAHLSRYTAGAEEALTLALATTTDEPGGEVTARLAASQVIAVQRVLATANWRRLVDGATAEGTHARAVDEADRAFRLLGTGIADHFG